MLGSELLFYFFNILFSTVLNEEFKTVERNDKKKLVGDWNNVVACRSVCGCGRRAGVVLHCDVCQVFYLLQENDTRRLLPIRNQVQRG